MPTYRDVDALALDPQRVQGDDDRLAINHVNKKRVKTKNAEVVFDPKQHKDFVTGFRKRKQQRRSKALKELQVKAKAERLEMRAEKRTKLKEELGVGDNWGIDDSEGEGERKAAKRSDADEAAAAAAADVRVYSGQGVTTTVTTLALDSDPGCSESEDEEDAGADDGLEAGPRPREHHTATGEQQGQQQGQGQPKYNSKRQLKLARKGPAHKHSEKGDWNEKHNKSLAMLQKLTSRVTKGSKGKGVAGGRGKSKKEGKVKGKAGKGAKGGR